MDIPALLSTIGSVFSLSRSLIDERDRHKAAAIQVDLTEKILEAQAKAAEVFGAVTEKDALVRALQERISELESHQAERARYQLAEASVGRKVFAYRLRPACELVERVDEPPHFICQPCLDVRKQKVVLQQRAAQGRVFLACAVCGCELLVQG